MHGQVILDLLLSLLLLLQYLGPLRVGIAEIRLRILHLCQQVIDFGLLIQNFVLLCFFSVTQLPFHFFKLLL